MSRTLARTDTKAEEDASTLVNNSKSNTHRKPISKTSSTYKQHHTNAKEARLVSSDRKRQARIPAPIIALKSSTTLPSPISILGAGRTDPFARYPVASSRKVECYDLVDHWMLIAPSEQSRIHKRLNFLPVFEDIRRRSFEVARSDAAAFSMILAIAAGDMAFLKGGGPHVTAMEYSARSTAMLRVRMGHKVLAIQDGTLATVALHIIYQLLFEDCDSLEAHADALEVLVNLRGGIEKIESQDPNLAFIINQADFLPPSSALKGRRRFHTTSTLPPGTILSPIALSPPRGLEAFVHFDIYPDLKRIVLEVQYAAAALRAGNIYIFYGARLKLRSQLEAAVLVGTSKVAWGRRSEVLKCTFLAALLYLNTILRRTYVAGRREEWRRLVRCAIAGLGMGFTEIEIYLAALLEDVTSSVSDGEADGKRVPAGLVPLMRIGARINGPQWLALRLGLQTLYADTCVKPLAVPVVEGLMDEREVNVKGFTALYEYLRLGKE